MYALCIHYFLCVHFILANQENEEKISQKLRPTPPKKEKNHSKYVPHTLPHRTTPYTPSPKTPKWPHPTLPSTPHPTELHPTVLCIPHPHYYIHSHAPYTSYIPRPTPLPISISKRLKITQEVSFYVFFLFSLYFLYQSKKGGKSPRFVIKNFDRSSCQKQLNAKSLNIIKNFSNIWLFTPKLVYSCFAPHCCKLRLILGDFSGNRKSYPTDCIEQIFCQ